MRYFLDTDESSHWYLIPTNRRQEWDAWRDLDPDSEEAWDPPEFAQFVDGPQRVTFSEPKVGEE